MTTRAEWAERVARWEASGLSATEFSAREGILRKRLIWWRWRLQSLSQPASVPPVEFVPVRIVAPAARSAGVGGPIEIALPNGRVVRVPVGFDAAELERVLAVASEGAC